jgi:opacity protein-like surface antigen
MTSNISKAISTAVAMTTILTSIGTICCQRGDANERNFGDTPTQVSAAPSRSITFSSLKIAQNPNTPTQQQLDQQRDAERVLKQGETIKQEIRDSGSNNGNLERQVGEQVTKVRESGSDPRKVREAERELTRLRQQNNRNIYYSEPFYYPYSTSPSWIFVPDYYPETPSSTTPAIGQEEGVTGSSREVKDPNSAQIFGTAGFTNGNVAPSIGVRFNNIGFEVGAIFNQDSLASSVNDFALPNNFFFTDLGVKKLSPQFGFDLLGFVDVAPRVSVYGSVGLYFQSVGRVAQSLATNDLYKQTDLTNTTGAFGTGVTYNPSDSLSIGLGYHSLRGINVRLGFSF